jgi:hypothetical protein
MEARIRRGSGEYRWFLIRIGPSRNDSGDIVKWYGTSTDIEELRQTDSLRAARKDDRRSPRVRSPAQANYRHDSAGACLVQFGAWFERIPQQAMA